ncbi:MAG: hypothetical protein PWR10_1825 [Halanaerobiales bacterium]|nr:hypothetical protein [Halanaerobiales bacterium]
MAEFKDRLKKLRKEKGLYQKELAKIIGVSDGAIAMYETGKRTPDKEILDKLANYFDVSVDYLLGRTDERSPADKIKAALSDDPELADFWEKLSQREDLQLLFKQTKDMSPEGVRQIIRIIKAIEDEEQERYNGR